MQVNIEELGSELSALLGSDLSSDNYQELKVAWMGKEGKLKQAFGVLRELSNDEKPKVAATLNEYRDQLDQFFRDQQEKLNQATINKKLAGEFIDFTLPGKTTGVGHLHPLRLVEQQITQVLQQFGFSVVDGPEVETEYYCFDALNIPKHHPARDMQDTFFTENDHVLRTHTTSILARELHNVQKGERSLPLKSIYTGRVYRNESEDASHQAMFHQYDLVWIEEGIGLAHLMGLITAILKGLYGDQRQIRFVPKFYPYTEPSLGAQIDCKLCQGKGCPACDGVGWVTVVGSGVVHRNVLNEFDLDPDKIGGVAFGFGSSRLAGQFYQAPNLKTLYDADLRYLKSL